jgi:kynurenine formamidase
MPLRLNHTGICSSVALALLVTTAAVASERGIDAQVGKSSIGAEDQLGKLSLMTSATQAKILACASASRIYDLAFDFFSGMPSFTELGDPPYQFWMTHTPAGARNEDPLKVGDVANRTVTYSGDAVAMYTHVGTHIDSLAHFGLHGRVWNGFEAASHLGDKGWDVNGANKIPPIVARGILIDLPAAKNTSELPAGQAITPSDIQRALTAQKVTITAGDVVLIRTGRGAKFADADAYKANPPGLTVEAARLLAQSGAMIVGVDLINPERMPSGLEDNYLPVHTYLLGEQGILILENLNLEALSQDRVYEFALIAASLKYRGASGAPLRPLALPLQSSGCGQRRSD